MCTGIGRALNLSVAAYPRLGRPTAKSCAFAGDSVPSVMAQPVMMGQPVMAQAQPVQQPQMQMMQVQVRQPHAHALPPAQHTQVHRLRVPYPDTHQHDTLRRTRTTWVTCSCRTSPTERTSRSHRGQAITAALPVALAHHRAVSLGRCPPE